MGARGPRKKLSALKLLEGNPGKQVIEASGIEGLGEPFVADHLMDDARGCIEVIRQSMPARVYSALDSFALAAYGMAWAIHKRASLEISNPKFDWLVSNTKNNYSTANPWIRILNAQAGLLVTIGDRLGLDPKSRAALHLPAARQQSEPIESMIGRKRSYNLSSNLSSHPERDKAQSSN